jgi:uncharacterized protein YqgV (UPF0045/DUF77 family)
MGKSYKDDVAFNNLERDLKRINREKKVSDEPSLSEYVQAIREELANRLCIHYTLTKLDQYLTPAGNFIETQFKNKVSVKDCAKLVNEKFEPEVFGFSHNRADLWNKNQDSK